MNSKEFSQLLRKIGACGEACEWSKGKSLAEVWEQCERGDWLLWLCGRMVDKDGWPTRKELVLAAAAYAATAAYAAYAAAASASAAAAALKQCADIVRSTIKLPILELAAEGKQ